jgi:hypothetical protein
MILLTWNRDFLGSWPEYAEAVASCGAPDGFWSGAWSVGRRKNIEEGTTCFILAQGRTFDKGLVARGFTLSEPYPGNHWLNPDIVINYVDIIILGTMPLNMVVPLEIISRDVPKVAWHTGIRGSGYCLPVEAQAQLVRVWDNQYNGKGALHAVTEEITSKDVSSGKQSMKSSRPSLPTDKSGGFPGAFR